MGGTRRVLMGLALGAGAGILDLVPMIFQRLPLEAMISAFSMWIAVGVLVSTSSMALPSPVRGTSVALLVLAPCAVLIGAKEPIAVIPVAAITLVLGSVLGHVFSRLCP